jgi:hypothetical protein
VHAPQKEASGGTHEDSDRHSFDDALRHRICCRRRGCTGIRCKEVGSFHIGGQALKLEGLPVKELAYTAGGPPTKMDPNGDFHTGQMYVQYIKLANPKAKYPLLLWHGGGLTGVTWETKPDGTPG